MCTFGCGGGWSRLAQLCGPPCRPVAGSVPALLAIFTPWTWANARLGAVFPPSGDGCQTFPGTRLFRLEGSSLVGSYKVGEPSGGTGGSQPSPLRSKLLAVQLSRAFARAIPIKVPAGDARMAARLFGQVGIIL